MVSNQAFAISGTVIGAVVAVSNIVEITILARKGKSRTKADDIILSLSCADMLVGFSYLGTLSIALTGGVENKNITNMIASVLLIFCFNTSVFHILTIAVERFYAVRCPIKYRTVMTREITHKMIIGLWILSTCVITGFAVPDILQSSKLLAAFKGYFIVTSGAVVIVCYGYLSYAIWKSGKLTSSATAGHKTNDVRASKQLRDTIFSYAIAISYIICSFPFAVAMIFRITDVPMAELMLVINSLIDPILYFWKGYYDKRQRENRSKRALVNRSTATFDINIEENNN